MTVQTTSEPRTEQRRIPLSRIVVVEGHNPRVEFDAAEQRRLNASIKERGILTPIRVAERSDGDYDLIAGERRYRAAVDCALMEVPAIVVIREPDEDAAAREGALLEEAIAENTERSDLTYVEEARGVGRLKALRYSERAIAERLRPGVSRDAGRRWVKERLAILQLPEELHAGIADKSIPLKALDALLKLAQLDPQLALLAASLVGLRDGDGFAEPLRWDDVIEDPIDVATTWIEAHDLPAHVFKPEVVYPIGRFELDAKTRRKLDQLCELTTLDPQHAVVKFTGSSFEHAEKLGAAVGDRWRGLIVGQDVADTLVADIIDGQLRQAKEDAKLREQRAERVEAAADGLPEPSAFLSPEERAAAEEQRAAERVEAQRAERRAAAEAQRLAQERAEALGAAVYKNLSRVKADVRVLKVLTSVQFAGNADAVARRGARYGLPGWVEHEPRKKGGVKRIYLDGADLRAKVRSYLEGADSVGDVAGRVLSLLTMAVLLDESELVANSNRTHGYVDVTKGRGDVPWGVDATRLIEEIALERLPAEHTSALRERHEREQQAADELAKLLQDPGTLTDEQVEQAQGHADLLYGRFSPRAREVETTIRAARAVAAQQSVDDAHPEADG